MSEERLDLEGLKKAFQQSPEEKEAEILASIGGHKEKGDESTAEEFVRSVYEERKEYKIGAGGAGLKKLERDEHYPKDSEEDSEHRGAELVLDLDNPEDDILYERGGIQKPQKTRFRSVNTPDFRPKKVGREADSQKELPDIIQRSSNILEMNDKISREDELRRDLATMEAYAAKLLAKGDLATRRVTLQKIKEAKEELENIRKSSPETHSKAA